MTIRIWIETSIGSTGDGTQSLSPAPEPIETPRKVWNDEMRMVSVNQDQSFINEDEHNDR